ncbi:MAG TPA: hypothetical protein PLQ56_22185 [Aggregatilineales bacterium]|nr:hypothetical protein [Aggregatilineales bacterium]
MGLRDLYRNLNFSAKQARTLASDLMRAGLIEEWRVERAEWFIAVEHIDGQADTPTTDDKLSVLAVTYRQSRRIAVNHTQRVAHVSRQRRYLTNAKVREVVERYLATMADEIASGEWVDISYIGKVQVVQEEGSGYVNAIVAGGTRAKRRLQIRLRTRVRLNERFKRRCRAEWRKWAWQELIMVMPKFSAARLNLLLWQSHHKSTPTLRCRPFGVCTCVATNASVIVINSR